MFYPKISIITPSYNQGKFIEKTIQSVIEQDYPHYEHIIIDGGSTDGTLEILKRYQDVLIFVSEKDEGQVSAINKGLKIANGEIISFLNSDDYYLPHTFTRMREFFSKPECAWLIGDSVIVDENDREIQKFIRYYKKTIRMLNSYKVLLLTNFICQPSTFWRKDFLETVGYFDEKLSLAFDYKQWLLMYQKKKPIVTNYALSAFRIHKASKGSLYFREQMNEELTVLQSLNIAKTSFLLHKLNLFFIKFIYSIIK